MVIHQTQLYSCFYTSRRITINPHKIIQTKCYTQHVDMRSQGGMLLEDLMKI